MNPSTLSHAKEAFLQLKKQRENLLAEKKKEREAEQKNIISFIYKVINPESCAKYKFYIKNEKITMYIRNELERDGWAVQAPYDHWGDYIIVDLWATRIKNLVPSKLRPLFDIWFNIPFFFGLFIFSPVFCLLNYFFGSYLWTGNIFVGMFSLALYGLMSFCNKSDGFIYVAES
jgi:hypothetical protein